MKALLIVCAVIAALLLISTIRIKLFFSYCDKSVELKIKVLCFSIERELAMFKKEGKEEAEKKAAKKKAKEKEGKKEKGPAKKKSFDEIKELLNILADAVRKFLKKFGRYARLEKYTLKIDVGTDDPAKTAVLYGSLSPVVCSLHALASSVKNRSRKAGDLYTEFKPDFLADKTDIAAELGFSLRIWQILSCVSTALKGLIKFMRRMRPASGKKNNLKGEKENERILSQSNN